MVGCNCALSNCYIEDEVYNERCHSIALILLNCNIYIHNILCYVLGKKESGSMTSEVKSFKDLECLEL